MRTNAQDHKHSSDASVLGNHSHTGISARDRSLHEDSNMSLLHTSEALNISIVEGISVPKIEQTPYQRPLRCAPSSGDDEKRITSQIINVRASHSRLQSKDMSLLQSQVPSESESKILLFDSSGIFKKDSNESRDFEGFLLKKSLGTSSVPKDMERSKISQLETSTGLGHDGQTKQVDIKDYTSYDLAEEQDVVHSLQIKNKHRNERGHGKIDLEEETKGLTNLGKSEHSVNRHSVQRGSTEMIRIKSTRIPSNGNKTEEEKEEENVSSGVQRNNFINSEQANRDDENPSPQQQNVDQVQQNNRAENFQATLPPPTQNGVNISAGIDFEIKPFLRKKMALFATFLLSSLFLWFLLNGVGNDFRGVITPFYCYFAYLGAEALMALYKARNHGVDIWMKKESKLEALSALSYILTLLIFDLRISDKISMSVLATIPLLITTTLYPFLSTAPDSVKISAGSLKFVFALQTLLITLRIDGTLTLDWALVLIVCLVILGVLLGYCVIYGFFIFLLIFLRFFRGYQGGRLGCMVQFIGLFWYFVYYGLSGAAFLILIGISQYTEPPGSTQLLRVGAQVGIALNTFLFAFTLVQFKTLTAFTQVHFEAGGLMGNSRTTNIERLRPTVAFQIHNDQNYFIGLSSTYFLPLTRNFLSKNKANLDRIKGIFRDFKFKRSSSKSSNANKETKPSKLIGLTTLKTYKEALDEKLNKALKNPKENPEKTSSVHKFLKMFSPKNMTSSKKNAFFDKNSIPNTSTSQFIKAPKYCLSADNLDDLESVYPAQKHVTQGEEEKLCYLCYSHAPDGILMNCGHGGFCYQCAIAAVQAKNECMECRAKVEAIHKIDVDHKLSGVIKTVETRKVIVSDGRIPLR